MSHLLEFSLGRLELCFYFDPRLLEHLPRLSLGRFHHLRGFGFGLAALGLAPRDCALADRGEPRIAFLMGCASLA